MDDHPEHRVEQQWQHSAVDCGIAADVVPTELHLQLDTVGIEAAQPKRRHEQTSAAGQIGHPGRGADPFTRLMGRQQSVEFFDPVGDGLPGTRVCVDRHREVLRAAHSGDEAAESRSRVGWGEPREAASWLRLRILGGLGHGPSTSRRTMVCSLPGPTPIHETGAPARSSTRNT